MRPILVRSTKLGTMMNELVVDDFLDQTILVPQISEQGQIGRFFSKIDSLITLHQRKELASVVNCLQIGDGPINPNRTVP